MSGLSAHSTESVPNCPRCERPMVLRTARKGAKAGNQFWGCTEFPRCRGTLQIESPVDAAGDTDRPAPSEESRASVEGESNSEPDKMPQGFFAKVAKTVDKVQRRYLESDEPDATGRWNDDHRRSMLKYVYRRDGGRCGLCGAEMKLKGAQIEHIVPKVFVFFDVNDRGNAEPGAYYTSRLHKIDNLQAAHTYCNKRKANKPEINKWRHETMPPLTVADTEDDRGLVLPANPAP
ncbi:MAG: hypothetical protein F4Y27_04380 [Acidimicrobiaceae bacterium]|nr:hypothetical protein [Acidimicrobiaceae bacterium]MXW75463.1 hypothetical protein [Acidimicrobiaceae bacterium]MYA73893.1 hypothetical protein [Acidimicrobiaceae bacterium]MYC43842.1 hypothetical protein [Acidimicrobiaceae bacterium]MYD05955.1 hypothetical protein [Acidimicrobiaceae bacterium]